MTMGTLFYEIFNNLPRQGPGLAESTRKAFYIIPAPPSIRKILDIGCGSGMQTLELAALTGAEIVAIDNNPAGIDTLQRQVDRAGLGRRVTCEVGDMLSLNVPRESLDLIWCEGAIFIIGFERGLKEWRELLRPGGFAAISELTWLTNNPHAEIREYFAGIYPDMRTAEDNLAVIDKCGYRTIDHFTLPEEAWWNDYYLPMETEVRQARIRHANDPDAKDLHDALEKEIEMYRRHSADYGYVFYVIQRQD